VTAPLPPKRRRRERRQRVDRVSVRLLPAEHRALTDKARATGLSLGAFLRAAGLGNAGPRARRRPTVHAEALGRATVALSRLGSNVNQIAHSLNAGAAYSLAGEYADLLVEVRQALCAIREAAAGRTEADDHQRKSSQ
jgi:hypothetical protein